MKPDLKTEEGRKEAIKDLNIACDKAISEIGFTVAPNMVVKVDKYRVVIGIKNSDIKREGWCMEWASDIEISCTREDIFERGNEISFGATGASTPADKAFYWRTIHAAGVLLNWQSVSKVVDEYCNKYRELEGQIRQSNRVQGEQF